MRLGYKETRRLGDSETRRLGDYAPNNSPLDGLHHANAVCILESRGHGLHLEQVRSHVHLGLDSNALESILQLCAHRGRILGVHIVQPLFASLQMQQTAAL